MKAVKFVYEIFSKFPFLFVKNTVLLVLVNLSGACALVTISPLIDFFLHPDLKGVSPLTLKAVAILQFIGLPATLGSWLAVFMTFVVLSTAFLIFARHSILKTQYTLQRDIMMGAFKDFFGARWYFFSSGKQGSCLTLLPVSLMLLATRSVQWGSFSLA